MFLQSDTQDFPDRRVAIRKPNLIITFLLGKKDGSVSGSCIAEPTPGGHLMKMF